MFWKILKPTVFLAIFVVVISLSVVGIRRSWVAAAANDKFVCGTVVGLQGRVSEQFWQATVNDNNHAVLVPTQQAYSRLKVSKEFTFIYRDVELIAIADGNLCH